MATGTLTIATTATLTIGTTEYNLSKSHDVVNVTNSANRRVTVPFASEVELIKIGASVAAGQLTKIDALYIINQDAVNFVRIRFEDTGAHTYDVKLKAGESHLIWSVDTNVSETGVAFAAFSSIDTIAAQADTADVDVEFLAVEI